MLASELAGRLASKLQLACNHVAQNAEFEEEQTLKGYGLMSSPAGGGAVEEAGCDITEGRGPRVSEPINQSIYNQYLLIHQTAAYKPASKH